MTTKDSFTVTITIRKLANGNINLYSRGNKYFQPIDEIIAPKRLFDRMEVISDYVNNELNCACLFETE